MALERAGLCWRWGRTHTVRTVTYGRTGYGGTGVRLDKLIIHVCASVDEVLDHQTLVQVFVRVRTVRDRWARVHRGDTKSRLTD